MKITLALLVGLAGIAWAQSGVPTFPANGVQPGRLVPGMFVSIYGTDLGPLTGCIGKPDATNRETPSPLRPEQSLAETQIYPKEICGVQVLLGERPAELLYVSERQINFKVPQESAMEGAAPLRVVYQGRSSAAVEMPLGIAAATLSLEQPAHVGGPVWVYIEPPSSPGYGDVRYPFTVQPDDFGCSEVEVRRNGVPLPRIPLRATARVVNGLSCGSIGIARKPMRPMPHQSRLPVHLQYRFDQPGAYEVRYTRRRGPPDMHASEVLFQTAWTPIEIQPAQPVALGTPPQDPAESITDYLPGILGFPDAAHLAAVAEYLYDPSDTVRQYASAGLAYWPEDEVNRRLTTLLHTRGPSDVVAERTFRTVGAVDFILPALKSDNPVLVRGAIVGVTRMLFADPSLLSAGARARAEDALISASEHVLQAGDPQTGNYYASALGGVRDPRARELLWDFAGRNVLTEQSLIAITWFKNPADLPRFAALLETPAKGDPMERTYASLPYAIHRAYGDAALSALEAALRESGYVWVQTSCAQELVLAGRKSGFAFIAQAIEQNKFYRREMVQFVEDRFPELRGADEAKVLAFVKARE